MPSVLIVDDEPDGSEMVAHFLRRSGYQADCLPNGPAVMKALLEGPADAIVLDVRMPEVDGITLLEVLRSYLRWQTLPIVLLTAHADVEQIERARELGVRHVFQKANYDLNELKAVLDDLTAAPPQASRS
jgi:CheY-like chemotaxis protein